MMIIALWIIQALLALLFLFAGGMKLIMPLEEMMKQMPIALPKWFVLFTGIVEMLGGLGVILPWILGIKPGLTPLAAAGLVIVMIGATAYTLAAGMIGSAVLPFIVGILAAFVAYGRWQLRPQRA